MLFVLTFGVSRQSTFIFAFLSPYTKPATGPGFASRKAWPGGGAVLTCGSHRAFACLQICSMLTSSVPSPNFTASTSHDILRHTHPRRPHSYHIPLPIYRPYALTQHFVDPSPFQLFGEIMICHSLVGGGGWVNDIWVLWVGKGTRNEIFDLF